VCLNPSSIKPFLTLSGNFSLSINSHFLAYWSSFHLLLNFQRIFALTKNENSVYESDFTLNQGDPGETLVIDFFSKSHPRKSCTIRDGRKGHSPGFLRVICGTKCRRGYMESRRIPRKRMALFQTLPKDTIAENPRQRVKRKGNSVNRMCPFDRTV